MNLTDPRGSPPATYYNSSSIQEHTIIPIHNVSSVHSNNK